MLEGIENFLQGLFSNPLLIIIGFNILLGVGGVLYVVFDRIRVKQICYYFSENERLYEPVKIDAIAPMSLHSLKRGMRFFRTSPAYKSRVGNTLLWLAKRGSGYIFKLEETEEGKAIKIGTLWDALRVILGDELLEGLEDKYKAKLIDPAYFLTVELEKGMEPKDLPHMNENDINTETSRRMAELIFSGVKAALKEDWVRLIGMMAIGVALCLGAIRLGVL